MPIVLGWENASADPKDVLACASSPEVVSLYLVYLPT